MKLWDALPDEGKTLVCVIVLLVEAWFLWGGCHEKGKADNRGASDGFPIGCREASKKTAATMENEKMREARRRNFRSLDEAKVL